MKKGPTRRTLLRKWIASAILSVLLGTLAFIWKRGMEDESAVVVVCMALLTFISLMKAHHQWKVIRYKKRIGMTTR